MNIKKVITFTILILLLLSSLLLSLFFNLDNENNRLILYYIRIPNVIKAIITGSSLSLAGMILQSISKNPLADPYLTGLSSGAGLGIVISILCFSGINYSLFGFAGALLSAFLVILLCGFSKFSVTKLILIGLSLNIFASSIISFLILLNSDKAYIMTLILTGGFNNSDIYSNKLIIILFFVAITISAIFVPKLNLLRLDSKLIFNSQKDINNLNIIFVIISAFLTAISVYMAGILGFVGIIVPLLSKLIFGNDYRVLFFTNIVLGSSVLLLANFLSTRIIYPLQIPLGIVVAFIGAPVFVFFLLKKGGIFNDKN